MDMMARLSMSMALLACALLPGCPRQGKEPPIWDQVKIGELAPKADGLEPAALNTTNFDVYIFQVQQERVKQLRGLWDALNAKSIRFRSHEAFRSCAFRVAKGSAGQWDWIVGSLNEVGANKGATVSMWLSGDEENDIVISPLGQAQTVSFVDKDRLTRQVTVGPGRLVLRIRTEGAVAAPQARQLTAYPVFTVPAGGPIPELVALAKTREVAFLMAAFSTPVRQGDILVLGPEDYYGDSSTLGGLFFANPQGRPAVDARGRYPVRLRSTVRVYVIVCTRLAEDTR